MKVKELLIKIQELIINDEKYTTVKNIKNQEIYRFYNVKEKILPGPQEEYFDKYHKTLYQMYEETVIMHLTSRESPFLQLIIGDFDKAKIMYLKWEKRNCLSAYEYSLLEKLKQGKFDFSFYSPECDSISETFLLSSPAADGLRFIMCTLTVYVILSVIFIGIVLLITSIRAHGTVLFTGAPWYFGLIMAGLPAIFGGIALRNKLTPILYPRKKEKILLVDSMFNSKNVSAFAYVVFIITLIATIAVTGLGSVDGISFYDDHLTYSKSENVLNYSLDNVSYEDIDKIYKIEGRYNDYGDYISRASYIICFKDGTSLDLDGYTSVKTTEKQILPILEKHTGEPIHLKSDRDIPTK